ncbi:MAG: glycosyltransferase family 2 protein [Acidobacteriota bacterium]
MISVVVPVYDERETLDELVERVHSMLEASTQGNFEVIFVDDGSRDGSSEILDRISARDTRYKAIHFSRNFGQQPALQAGLDATSGDAVVLMDADLQDPPEVVGQLIEKWREGYDVVYAVRRNRKEPVWKRFAYATFYRTMRIIADIDVPADTGDFSLMDRQVVDALAAMPERNRFLRSLRSWVGFRHVGVEYDRDARSAGTTKYTLRKLLGLALSGYVGFSSFPLRLASWLGLLAAAVGFLVTIWVIFSRLTERDVPQGWASLSALILFVGGAQLMMLGIVGEYLRRVYDEVRNRPLYVVRSRVGFPAAVSR